MGDRRCGGQQQGDSSHARAALELADAEGVDALSMRRLAELLDGLIDAAVDDAEELRTDGAWRDSLRDAVMTARRNVLSHPALVELRFRRPVLRPEALRFAEAIMVILTGAGLPRDEAARAFRLLFTFLFGYAALSPAGTEEAAGRAARSALSALPPERYPASPRRWTRPARPWPVRRPSPSAST
jgi:hypothetical protein